MKQSIAEKLHALTYLVGNTPLLEIHLKFWGEERTLYAKAEHMNLTGSIKDRMALYILTEAAREGKVHAGTTIVEATSGNTGISFAALGRALGCKVVIFMPDWMSRERVDLIKSLGAEIRPVSREDGGFLGSIGRAREMADEDENVFLPEQFCNSHNVATHARTTGPEIWWQLRSRKLTPDAFVAGVGTGGTVMGVGRYLKERNPLVTIHPLEPANSPTLSTGHKVGKHRIQGISDEFIPDIVKLKELDDIIDVDDGDAILMAQKLSAELGLAVGISSGANFLGALEVARSLPENSVVTTVFADDNKKYLSTDLLSDEPPKKEHMAPEVELLGYSVVKRSCNMCSEDGGWLHRAEPDFIAEALTE